MSGFLHCHCSTTLVIFQLKQSFFFVLFFKHDSDHFSTLKLLSYVLFPGGLSPGFKVLLKNNIKSRHPGNVRRWDSPKPSVSKMTASF